MIALLPSPLLGAPAWEPVAAELRRGGVEVLVVGTPERPSGPDEVLAAVRAQLPVERPLVLVPHSNAGLYVPALTASHAVAAAVFVDAALPDEAETTAMAPAALSEHLTGLADADGWLPPWTRWWPEADIAPLFPSAAVRADVEASQPRLPLAYFAGSLPVPAGWVRTPCAYLAFGDTYAPERALAESRGWPVRTVAGRHLHLLVDPDAVAEAVTDLLDTQAALRDDRGV